MRSPTIRAACAAALLLALAACGNERGADGLTADERERLNQHAAELDGADVIDTSPDSLVANDALAEEPGEAAETGNGANQQ
jgi:hypothetical protein